MHLKIKNKFFSLGGSSKVLNDKNEKYLLVRGRMFSITKKKFVKDLSKKTIFMVRNKFWSWIQRKAFIYNENKALVATVIRDVNLTAGFTVLGAEEEIRVVSDQIGSFSLTILMGGKEIGKIKRPILTMTDTYEVDFEDEEDAPFLVALIIAMDNIFDRQRRKSN